jgi:hypothetical protein
MQRPAVQVFVGDQIQVQSERDFLAQVKADLESAGQQAVILANFFTRSGSRQVDFLIATDQHACHVELKGYDRVLRGSANGPWCSLSPDGTAETIDRQNPYRQAQDCKMAISDDMGALAARDDGIPRPAGNRKFFTRLESVVCVFPALADGSDVPSDYKVKTLGYREFFSRLSAPGRNPGWRLEHWQALIRDLSLVNAGQAQPDEGGQTAALALVSDYRQRFDAFHRRGLHELVPVPLTVGGEPVQPGDLPAVVRSARHVELTGRSGAGKSHLLRHYLLGLDTSVLPIVVEAGMYQGRLSSLTDRSVARFTTSGTTELLRAAAICGQAVLLAVDGLNECPGWLRETLAGDLDAFCLRTRAQTVITSQDGTEPASGLATAVVRAGDLGDADRRAVLASYGADGILPFCDPFTTPYELSVAAACAAELHGPVTRATLFSSFVRRQLAGTASPAAVRDTLRQLALTMDEQLATWLPLDEVWRVSEEHLARLPAPVGVVDEVLACALVRTSQGKLSFTHELLGRFLVLEALRRDHADPPSLARQLRLPRHAGLPGLAVEIETDPARISGLMASLASPQVYTSALRGDGGRPAQRAAEASAAGVLTAVTSGLADTTFTIRSQFEATVAGGHELSEADRALLSGIGAVAAEGRFTAEITTLLDATDAACRRSADLQQHAEGRRPSRSMTVSAVLEPTFGGPQPGSAASVLLNAARMAWPPRRYRRPNAGEQAAGQVISSLLDEITPQHHGRLLLLCYLLQAGDSRQGAGQVPQLLRLCWASGVYHIMLDSLAMTRSFAAAAQGTAAHDEIVEALDEIHTDNWALSTMLVEALDAYGLIEPPYDEELVQAQVAEALSRPQDQDARELAYTIVSNQFEDVVSAPYLSVIDALDPGRRTTLYTLAAVGSQPYAFWNDWLLDCLADSGDPQAMPAFERWATRLYTDTPSCQQAARCYAIAVRGWAQHQPGPPPLADAGRGDAYSAWEHYAAILFWLYRPGSSPAEAARRCEPHWQQLHGPLLHSAADPLYQLENSGQLAGQDGVSPVARIMRAFPGEVKPVLEWGIQHPEQLTAVFRPVWGDRTKTLIRLLAQVGNAGSTELLRRYTDDPELGPDAIAAIRYLAGKLD